MRRTRAVLAAENRATARPHIALLAGYGLFKILMDRTYTTASSTIENSHILINSLSFSIASSFFILLTSAVLTVLYWRRPTLRLDVPAIAALLILACANPLLASGLLARLPPGAETVVPSAVYGVAAIIANTVWLVPFASLRPRRCLALLAFAMLAGSVGTALVGSLPAPAQPWALFVAGVASAILYACHNRQCGEPPAPATRPTRALRRRRIADAASYLAGPFIVYAATGLILGLVTAFQVSGLQETPGLSVLRNVATAAAYALVVCLALFARSTPSIRKTFGRACPAIALILIAMPFVDTAGGAVFTSALAAFNAFASVSMLFLLLEYARAAKLPAGAAVGTVTFLSRLVLLAGLVGGALLGMRNDVDATVRSLIVAIASIYLLMLVLVAFARNRRAPLHSDSVALGSLAQDGKPAVTELADGPSDQPAFASCTATDGQTGTPQNTPAGPTVANPAPDTYEQRADALGRRHRLTVREQEVLLLLARGRSATYVADELGLATSTVRSYAKSLYAKLGIHSKQELIDLFSDGTDEMRDAERGVG